jgi:hypothetical protein
MAIAVCGFRHPRRWRSEAFPHGELEWPLAVGRVIVRAVHTGAEDQQAKSPEEAAAEWLLSQQTHASYRATLIAGWTMGALLTAREINALVAQVVRIGKGRLDCVLLDRVADTEELRRARLPIHLGVGLLVARAAPDARLCFSVEQLRREPSSEVHVQLGELFPGALHGDPALHLWGGMLRFGPRFKDESFLVVESAGSVVVDVSPEAHAARVAMGTKLGFQKTALPYTLLARRSG